jgi:hypothetical protein
MFYFKELDFFIPMRTSLKEKKRKYNRLNSQRRHSNTPEYSALLHSNAREKEFTIGDRKIESHPFQQLGQKKFRKR